ncbi:hypothetical protein [Vibrio sp. St2]|uniref:hypothetical protein n=1 Tax=Vibrio sp. St2 TaxID=2853441 RepID=UPI00248D4E20|nr:hypothetical protein [Vibrio sp. St2]
MKRSWILSLTLAVATLGLSGCGSTSNKSDIDLTSKFRVTEISVDVTQYHEPELEYHSKEELSQMVSSLIKTKLAEKGLLSDKPEMDAIAINVDYYRRFVGDATPIPSDSLAPPKFDYDVQLSGNEKPVTLIDQKKLTYNGGFAFNLQVLSGTIRDKSAENDFAEAIANHIVEDIEKLN